MILVRLALRNLARHPWRTTATVLGVALGIAAVLATLSVGDNVEANIRSTLEAAAGSADLLVTPGAEGRAVFAIEDVLEVVSSTPGVAGVQPVLNTRAEPVRELGDVASSVIPGVDSGFQLSGRDTTTSDVPVRVAAGDLPAAGSRGVAITSDFAAGRGIALGDTVGFATQFGEVPLRVTGLLDDAVGFASTNGGRVGVVALADLQEILRLSGRASFLEVRVAPEAPSERVKETLEEALGPEYAVSYPAGSGNVATGIVETIQAGLSVLAATLLALGGFLAYNTFFASVVERTREYALLRTICLTRRQVERMALAEAAATSVLGVVAGLLLGLALAYLLTRANALSLGIEFRTVVIPVGSVVLASAVGVAVSLLAGVLPARAAARIPPLAALRQAEEREVRAGAVVAGWLLIAAGAALALLPWRGPWALAGAGGSMALLFVGLTLATPALLSPALLLLRPVLHRTLGVPGRLGAGLASRSPVRNGVAIGTVVVGIALIIGVGSMVAGINSAILSWVETTIVGDLFVTTPVSFPADFERAAPEAVPELGAVSGVGLRVVRFQPADGGRGRSIALILVDPERFDPEAGFGRFQYLQGQGSDEAGYRALAEGGQVLVASTMMERFGLVRGDIVTLRTNQGFAEFGVAGVVVDFTGGGEAAVGSMRDLDRFGGGVPDLYVMTVREGADPEAARAALIEAFPELHLDVTLNESYRRHILEQSNRTFATTNILLFLAVFIAALGVANTLGMNLAGRVHEVAVLRTLGLTRGGVRRMVIAEGVVVVLVGTVLGIACGLLLSRVITSGAAALTGFVLEPAYPWRLVVIALLGSPLVALLASLLPARRAARLPPVLALGAEE